MTLRTVEEKPIWKSRIFWVNLLTLLVGVLLVFAGSEVFKEYPKVVATITTILVPTINIILRWLTNQPISGWVTTSNARRNNLRGK